MRFDSYHPIINFIYFAIAFTCTICLKHPVFLAISYGGAFLYSVKLNGKRALFFNLCLIPVVLLYTYIYSCYNHFGVTSLGVNSIGNHITLESIITGFVIGIRIATVIMLCSCMFVIVSADKIVYLFGRISPKLSLFLSVIFRTVPRIKVRGMKVELARQGIGCGIRQGNSIQRLLHLMSWISIVITWTLEDFVESAASMQCRGYSLKGRTAFSIYRFDNRDRGFVLGVFFLLMCVMLAVASGCTTVYYNPMIVVAPVTVGSVFFYVAYGVLLLLPFLVQCIGEWRFKRLKNK